MSDNQYDAAIALIKEMRRSYSIDDTASLLIELAIMRLVNSDIELAKFGLKRKSLAHQKRLLRNIANKNLAYSETPKL